MSILNLQRVNTENLNENQNDLTQEEIYIINRYLSSTIDSSIDIKSILQQKCGKVLNYLIKHIGELKKNETLKNLINKILNISHTYLKKDLD